MAAGSPLQTFQSVGGPVAVELTYIDVSSFEIVGWYTNVSPAYFSSTEGFEIKHPISIGQSFFIGNYKRTLNKFKCVCPKVPNTHHGHEKENTKLKKCP